MDFVGIIAEKFIELGVPKISKLWNKLEATK